MDPGALVLENQKGVLVQGANEEMRIGVNPIRSGYSNKGCENDNRNHDS
jgi:hypothetical protein